MHLTSQGRVSVCPESIDVDRGSMHMLQGGCSQQFNGSQYMRVAS